MYTVKQENFYYRNLIINSNLKKKNNFLRVVKISSSRRIRKRSRHWGPEAPTSCGVCEPPGPPAGCRGGTLLGVRGRNPREQNRLEVFALAAIGSPEPESNDNKRSICFE